ncbi:hypothetical protein RI129_002429 [Pyrocoelia pectoralis]|uniref:Uncharacterized protein n=1 Tax=Pyrocoelia pectoralis TaxID=417401 RepID=A0AAN7ZLC6_9COLE
MKSVILILLLLKIHDGICGVSFQKMSLDPRTEYCIKERDNIENLSLKYAPLQIITGLSQYRLSVIGRYELMTLTNAYYNDFLKCAWIEYDYLKKSGDVLFENIEKSLKLALIKEVGETGPGINLSKIQAKKIVSQCTDISGMTVGMKVVEIQNCIHKQIQYLNQL